MYKDTLERQAEYYARRLQDMEERLAALEVLGEDDWPDETVIFFRKQFRPGGKYYSYAVIKAEGLWYTTGPNSPKGYTWAELVPFMLDGLDQEGIWAQTELERIY